MKKEVKEKTKQRAPEVEMRKRNNRREAGARKKEGSSNEEITDSIIKQDTEER